MSAAEMQDIITLTRRYYARLGQILAEVPDDGLSARVGDEGLTVAATIHHVCQSDFWYRKAIDGSTTHVPELPPERGALLDCLARTEADWVAFLATLSPEVLDEPRRVPAWWAEHSECSVRIILMHSLAHKYYHCGQLQSTIYALQGR